MAGSPRLIFKNYTDAQLLALHASVADRLLNGTFTSLSGQGHSSQMEWANPEDLLYELNFEMGRRGLGEANISQKLYQQFSNTCPTPSTITFQQS